MECISQDSHFSVWCLLPDNKMQRLSRPIPGRRLATVISDSVIDFSSNTNERDRYRWFNSNQIYIHLQSLCKKPTNQPTKKPKTKQEKEVIPVLINLDY